MLVKSHKDETTKENYRPILFINIGGVETLNKMSSNQIQEHIKRSSVMIK